MPKDIWAWYDANFFFLLIIITYIRSVWIELILLKLKTENTVAK